MLSDHERRVLDEIERQLAVEDHESGRPGPALRQRPGRDGHQPVARAVLIIVGWLAVFLLIAGAAVAALALAVATALGWLLWRYWPELSDDGATTLSPQARQGPARGPSTRRPGGEWLSQYLKRISEVE